VGNVSMNVYAKFRCASLSIKKALGIFRELITTTTEAQLEWLFGTRLPGPKIQAMADCTRLLQQKKTSQQNVSIGVSELCYTGLIFVDPGVRVNGAYYYDSLLS